MPDRDKPRQMPFELGHDPSMSRDDLIVTTANREALGFVERWPDWPANLAVLAGPAGSGKTHLSSIWSEASHAVRIAAGNSDEYVADGAANNILIENIDCGPVDETGLFHLINMVRDHGGYLLISARTHPSSWKIELPDLASRLKSATLVTIGEPDDLLLGGVITKLFADRQIEIDQSVVAYLVRRMERSLVTANRLVDRLDGLALERKVKITRALANEVLGEPVPE